MGRHRQKAEDFETEHQLSSQLFTQSQTSLAQSLLGQHLARPKILLSLQLHCLTSAPIVLPCLVHDLVQILYVQILFDSDSQARNKLDGPFM